MKDQTTRHRRREYIRKKLRAIGKQLGGHMLFLFTFTMTLVCGMLAVLCLCCALVTEGYPYVPCAVVLLLLTVAGAFGAVMLDKFINDAEREEALVAYVPPATPNNLPAREILLRMSEPVRHTDEWQLLKPAGAIMRASDEPLLRAVVMEQGQG